MQKMNNKGMTLVEMIIGIALMAIAGIMLVTCFSSSAKIVNKATQFKLASASAAEAIELQSEDDGAVFSGKTDKVTFKVGTDQKEYTAEGEFLTSTADDVGLTYTEFLTGSFEEFEE